MNNLPSYSTSSSGGGMLPQLGMHDDSGAQSLIVDMIDTFTELQVSLVYTVFPGLPAVSRRMIVRNADLIEEVVLQKAASGRDLCVILS